MSPEIENDNVTTEGLESNAIAEPLTRPDRRLEIFGAGGGVAAGEGTSERRAQQDRCDKERGFFPEGYASG